MGIFLKASVIKAKLTMIIAKSPRGLNLIFFCSLSGLFSPFNSAENPVSSLHKKSTVQHPENQPKSLPVLQAEEMYRRRNEP